MYDARVRHQNEWTLRLYGEFELLNDAGDPLRVPGRKAEALLALLAAHRKYGIERDLAAEILWPDKSLDSRRTNLRQALKLLRGALGANALAASRTHCVIRSDFPLVSDFDEPTLRRADAFMPGHEGEWFAEIRRAEDSTGESKMLDGLLDTARWLARHEPSGMFALLKASPSLTRGLDSRDLMDLMTAVESTPGTVGWRAYWIGTAEEDLRACGRHLRAALLGAKRTQDIELASEVCLELGKVYARTGQFDRAATICSLARAVADDSRSPASAVNALRLEGVVLAHGGRHEAGIRLLTRSESKIGNPAALAAAMATRAFFEAATGQFEKARTTLESQPKEAAKLGHRSMDLVSQTTQAMLVASGGRRNAVTGLERVSEECHAHRMIQFAVYADELLAKLFVLEGDKELAQRRLDAARLGRSTSRMAVTPLEKRLVTAMP